MILSFREWISKYKKLQEFLNKNKIKNSLNAEHKMLQKNIDAKKKKYKK